jgi:hypothetical protein
MFGCAFRQARGKQFDLLENFSQVLKLKRQSNTNRKGVAPAHPQDKNKEGCHKKKSITQAPRRLPFYLSPFPVFAEDDPGGDQATPHGKPKLVGAALASPPLTRLNENIRTSAACTRMIFYLRLQMKFLNCIFTGAPRIFR